MERKPAIDIMKGIAIILVIIGHLQIPVFFHHVIYSFHMPLFVIVSGYLFHEKSVSMRRVWADFKRLILPYLFTIGVLFIYTIFIFLATGGGNLIGLSVSSLYPDGIRNTSILPIWFLLAIFWCRQLMSALFYTCKNTCFQWGIIITLSWSAFLYEPKGVVPLCLTTGGMFTIFYLIGFHTSKAVLNKNIFSLSTSFLIWVLYVWTLKTGVFHIYRTLLYPLYILGSTGAAIIVYQLSTLIEQYLPNIKHILGWFGKYSMIILCVHTIDRYIPLLHLMHLDQPIWLCFCTRLGVCAVGVFVVKKFKFLQFIFQVK